MKYDKYDKLNRSIPLITPLIPFPLTAPHSPFSPHTPLHPPQVRRCILKVRHCALRIKLRILRFRLYAPKV